MVSLFRHISVWSCGILLTAIYSHAFAESGLNGLPDSASRSSYDEVIAYVPHQQAESPSVALAKVNIALYRAKQLTEERLCSGKWTPRGTLLYQQGSEASGAWFFESLRTPNVLICTGITRTEYFTEMSRHLPDWISVRPAGQTSTFRLGQAFTKGQHSLAIR
jgi:hypothetical protein